MRKRRRLYTFIMAALAAALLLAACQPTPEKAPVIGKIGDYLDAVEETPFKPYEAPSSINESEEINGLNLKIDAAVTVPNTDGYSVMEVTKQVFDVNTYKKIMNYFHPNETWYKEPVLTKEEIVNRIAYYKTNGDPESEELQETIKGLQEQLDSAPEEVQYEPFSFNDISHEDWFYAYCRNQDDGKFSVLSGQINSNTFAYCRDSDEYWLSENHAETDQEKNDFINLNPKISPEDAQKLAEQAMRDLNADPNMRLSYYTKTISHKNEIATSAGWELCFTRDCNGLQASYVGSWETWKGSPAPVSVAPWEKEVIFITVDDRGIAIYDTRGAGKQENVVFNNIELMAFDDILDRIKQQLAYNHAYHVESVEKASVVVNGIKLGSSLINIKDHPDVGRLIPSWDVDYDYYETLAGQKEPTVFHCHVYLNAIDGSYIEPRVSNDQLMSMS